MILLLTTQLGETLTYCSDVKHIGINILRVRYNDIDRIRALLVKLNAAIIRIFEVLLEETVLQACKIKVWFIGSVVHIQQPKQRSMLHYKLS